jgi:hypothetical protein
MLFFLTCVDSSVPGLLNLLQDEDGEALYNVTHAPSHNNPKPYR